MKAKHALAVAQTSLFSFAYRFASRIRAATESNILFLFACITPHDYVVAGIPLALGLLLRS